MLIPADGGTAAGTKADFEPLQRDARHRFI
jgi:hypothetical protein